MTVGREETEKAEAVASLRMTLSRKHLPGRHEQLRHGRRGRSRDGANSTPARRSGATSPRTVDDLFRSGLPDFGAWQRAGTGADRSSEEIRRQTRAAALAKQEVASDLARRMKDVPDKQFLDEGTISQAESIKSGKMVLMRKPGKELAEQQKSDSAILPNQLTSWDYRWMPRERYEARIAADPDAFKKIGGEVVEVDDYLKWNREAVVSRMVARWAWSSNDTDARALALQDIAQEMFGLDDVRDWPDELADEDLKKEIAKIKEKQGPLYRAFLKSQHDATQEMFAKAGIAEIEVHRGIMRMGSFGDGDTVKLRPLSSFTFDSGLAEEFAQLGDKGATMSQTIPVERILSIPRTGIGALTEAEVVVLGGGDWKIRGES